MKICPQCKRTYSDASRHCQDDGFLLKAAAILEPGARVREWEILRELGAGGMGTVYLVQHRFLPNRERALKLLRPEFAADQNLLQLFQNEAVTADRVNHENVVKIDDFGIADDGSPFIVMEYVNGQTLEDLLRPSAGRRTIDPGRALRIASHICSGLGAAHRVNVIHRDIKPSNILVSEGDRVKVVDFGIAKLKERDKSLPASRILALTPKYASPEQAAGKPGSQLDGRSDLYSLGVVLYEILTAEPPFSGSLEDLLHAHLYQEPIPPRIRRPDLNIPESAEAIVVKAMSKNPGSRFRSADEMRAALDRAIVELGNAACASSSLQPIPTLGRQSNPLALPSGAQISSLEQWADYAIEFPAKRWEILQAPGVARWLAEIVEAPDLEEKVRRFMTNPPSTTPYWDWFEKILESGGLLTDERRQIIGAIRTRLDRLREGARDSADARDFSRAIEQCEEADDLDFDPELGEIRLQARRGLEEDAVWARASELKDWEAYLQEYPTGYYAEEARGYLATKKPTNSPGLVFATLATSVLLILILVSLFKGKADGHYLKVDLHKGDCITADNVETVGQPDSSFWGGCVALDQLVKGSLLRPENVSSFGCNCGSR